MLIKFVSSSPLPQILGVKETWNHVNVPPSMLRYERCFLFSGVYNIRHYPATTLSARQIVNKTHLSFEHGATHQVLQAWPFSKNGRYTHIYIASGIFLTVLRTTVLQNPSWYWCCEKIQDPNAVSKIVFQAYENPLDPIP